MGQRHRCLHAEHSGQDRHGTHRDPQHRGFEGVIDRDGDNLKYF